MKAIEKKQEINHTRLFKPELKFMDIWHVTNDYLKTTSLDQEEKKEIMIRIHDFSLHLQNIINLYPLENKKHDAQTYQAIESALKEMLRRAKISMSRNQRFNSIFAGYWKFLAAILKNESVILNDEKLDDVFQNFDKAVDTIQVK